MEFSSVDKSELGHCDKEYTQKDQQDVSEDVGDFILGRHRLIFLLFDLLLETEPDSNA